MDNQNDVNKSIIILYRRLEVLKR